MVNSDTLLINAAKPRLWKADIAASIDYFNRWFMEFAPAAFRSMRQETTKLVEQAFLTTRDLRDVDGTTLKENPKILSTLRMCTSPPLAIDRLIGLAGVSKHLVEQMERGRLPVKMQADILDKEITNISAIIAQLLDRDIFSWLDSQDNPTDRDRERAATIVADRLCSAVTNPIIRNAQEQRQLERISNYLDQLGYRKQHPPSNIPLTNIEPGTYTFRLNVPARKENQVNVPIDVIIQPKRLRQDRLPIFIEAKSAGDFTNTNKRRKEEVMKMYHLRESFGKSVVFVLFLCGYFGSDYLGYVAAEGIDWVWEHRITDLQQLGL